MGNKSCPLAKSNPNEDMFDAYWPCDKEQCAWWSDDANKCAMLVIAESQRKMCKSK